MDLPKIAIPSYQRSSFICSPHGTLTFLSKSNYPSHLIYIFVASEEEAILYRKLHHTVIVGVLGLANQRNFIRDYFEDGEIYLSMDDDIRGVKTQPYMSFVDLVLKGMEEMNNGSKLWGIMPNDDGRKMKDKTTTHLAFIIGCFFLIKNDREIKITTSEKDDFERCILYFKKYGSVSRYNGAGVVTSYTKTAGGLQQEGRIERMLQGSNYLVNSYPKHISTIKKRKGLDVILNWRV